MRKINLYLILFCFLFSCNSVPDKCVRIDQYPDIYPEYINICVPYNIAPLNFRIKGECTKLEVQLSGKHGNVKEISKNMVSFSIKNFKSLLVNNIGDTIWITVSEFINGEWKRYKPFFWKVVPDKIDTYLTYRLIEPGYEVWNKITLAQRNISNFDEISIADNNLTEGSCMNCHIGSKQNPDKSYFFIRGTKGFSVLTDGKKLTKINMKPKGAYSNMTYGNWHPSGRYIAFSTNIILPATHSFRDQRAFVYDTVSDVVVLDLEKNEVLTCSLLSNVNKLETFPEFSVDGKKLYFCTAKKVKLPEEYNQLKYSLCSIDFDAVERKFGQQVDTLINSRKIKKSVSEPRSSPDGKYIMFTCFAYGTFPLWHNDARLYSFNLTTGQIDTLPELNNNKKYSNSYHCWSSNSRWVVFASKRDNGMYGKPYFSYVDPKGIAHKPFVLPQQSADFYDYTYKSFNIPELFEKARSFDALDIEVLFNDHSPVKQVNYYK
jgi:Tol biopolymer transport system component